MSGRGSSVAAAREGPRRAGRPPSQDRSPTALRPTDLVGMGAKSMGQLPADSLLAVPTRAYQSGGALIHALPARRDHTARPPPPSHQAR